MFSDDRPVADEARAERVRSRAACAIPARCFPLRGCAARCRARTVRIPPSVPALPNATDAVTEPGAIAAELHAGGQAILTRPPDAHADAVDGILPRIVVEAESRAAVAATLQWAGQRSLSVVVRGSGTKFGWGAVPAPFDVLLDVSRVNRVLDHRAGDLTVSVEAGARLGDVNGLLRQRGQWLALDPPFAEAATIGGLLATNDSGPQRHRFGTPRDLVIGIEIATMDGQIAKAGGTGGQERRRLRPVENHERVVRIARRHCRGNLQALAAARGEQPRCWSLISTATRRSASSRRLPRASSNQSPSSSTCGRRGGGTPEIACLLHFASVPAAVEAETANASGRVATVHPAFRVLTGDKERDLWRAHGRRPWEEPGIIVRASWLPETSRNCCRWCARSPPTASIDVTGRLGTGSGLFRIDARREAQVDVVARMRASGVFGNVVVLRAPAELKSREWVWGSPAGAAAHRRAEARARSGRAPWRGARSAVTTKPQNVQAVSEPAFDAHHPPAAALIDKCVHCGFCLPTCPTYALWGEEMDSPRGRLYLMKSGLEGRVGMTERFVGHFDACLGCMACVTACPSGVEYGPLIEDTRAQIERRFPRSARRAAVSQGALHAGAVSAADAARARCRAFSTGGSSRCSHGAACSNRLPHRVRALAKLAPPVSIRALTAQTPGRTPASGERRLTVGLLTGCVQRLVFSHVNEATIRVLAAEGCEVLAPPAQGCCGALAVHAGRSRRGARLRPAHHRGLRNRRRRARRRQRRGMRVVDEGVRPAARRRSAVGGARQGFHRQGPRRHRAARGARPAAGGAAADRPARRLPRRLSSGARAGHSRRSRASCCGRFPASSWCRSPRGSCAAAAPGSTTCVEPEPARQLGKRKLRPHHRRAPRRHRHGQPGMHAADCCRWRRKRAARFAWCTRLS